MRRGGFILGMFLGGIFGVATVVAHKKMMENQVFDLNTNKKEKNRGKSDQSVPDQNEKDSGIKLADLADLEARLNKQNNSKKISENNLNKKDELNEEKDKKNKNKEKGKFNFDDKIKKLEKTLIKLKNESDK